MPTNITDVDVFTDPVPTIATGDDGSAANFALSPQALANRTRNLKTKLDGVEGGAQVTSAARVLAALALAASDISVNGRKITSGADPTSPQDFATMAYADAREVAAKAYADALAQGLDLKASVRAVATSNITLSGTQTVDVVALAVGDRVLAAGQTTGSQNGIYVVAAGAWSRAGDADTSAEVTAGLYTFATEGAVNGDAGWALTTNDPIVLGTTALVFSIVTTIALATNAPAQTTKATAVLGTSARAAREDHKHDVATAVPSDVTKAAAVEGSSTSLARADHKHDVSTAAPANVTKAAAAEGTATSLARSDHKHDISTAAPGAVGSANAEGSATSLARSDHVHDASAKADVIEVINPQVGTAYTLVLSDAAPQCKGITMTNAAAKTLTVPSDATAAIPVGSWVGPIIDLGGGQTTVVAGSSAFFDPPGGLSAKIRATNCGIWLFKRAANTWIGFGDFAV